MDRWIYAFLALGMLGRAVRYFARFPLWEDECFVSVNFFRRGYLDLLKPLEYHQVGTYLWLWLQKTAVNLFGFNELSLRLFAFVSSILSLILFYCLVRRLVAGPARVICVAFFAVGYPCLRYAAEAKLYPFDLFTSLVLVLLWVQWLHRPDQRKWLIAMVVWAPLAIGLSYAAVFTAGAISLLFLWLMLRGRLPAGWRAWLIYSAAVVLGAALAYLMTARGQIGADQSFQSDAYARARAFPPLDSLGAFLKWMVLTHTGSLMAHPIGGENGGSALTLILCIIGAVVFVRHKEAVVPLALLTPLALQFAAAAMRRYPYAGHVKFSMYVAPMIYILFGVGIAALLGLDLRKGKTAAFVRNLRIVLILAVVLGVAAISRDLLHPYKTKSDQRARAFARWFWPSANFEDRAVDIKDDLGREFSQGTWRDLSWSAMYLANKYICGCQPIASLEQPSKNPQPRGKVLRCVLYRDPNYDFDQPAFDQWLAQMKQTHPYLGRDVYPSVRMDKRERRIVTIDYLEIYKFDLSE
ncbi:MAG: glycosyltransferase family 39 protein [Phycisphaerae bacterium]|nr:glycosyltransferase family 39 protein [Phycisphaerae bacterium]